MMRSHDTPGTLELTGADGVTTVILSEEQLQYLRKLAALRYTVSEIALMLDVPAPALRLRMADENSPESRAYVAGCLESEIGYRNKVRIAAEQGEEWAIRMIEEWKTAQQADELGCHI